MLCYAPALCTRKPGVCSLQSSIEIIVRSFLSIARSLAPRPVCVGPVKFHASPGDQVLQVYKIV